MLATELAIVNNFIWNNRWTFGCRGISVRRLLRFNLSSLAGVAVAIGTTVCLVDGGVPYLVANVTGVTSGAACNFAVSMLWTWRTAL
jgi:dolichol-phosphate mannosyltransferase